MSGEDSNNATEGRVERVEPADEELQLLELDEMLSNFDATATPEPVTPLVADLAAAAPGPEPLNFAMVIASSIHEMKNSIGMVVSSIDELVDPVDGRCHPEQLTQLRYESRRLSDKLIQLLTLYRIGDTGYQVAPNEYHVAEMIEEAYLGDQPLLAARGISMTIDCADDLFGFFDRELMLGVLHNIITNTLRYTRDHILISARRIDGWLQITIDDNGDGFPPAMLESMPKQYRRINFGNGRTGLGLYFCSVVAQLHRHHNRRGNITLTNDGVLGGGRFTICLP